MENFRLRDYSGIGLTIPWFITNSMNRAMLHYNGLRQAVPLVNPEGPIVETIYAPDLLRSTYNITAKNDVEVFKKIVKTINDKPAGRVAYILVDHTTKMIDIQYVDSYVGLNNDYGFKNISSLNNKNEGDILEKGDYIQRSSSYLDDAVACGKNLLTARLLSIDTIEDAYILNDKVKDKMEYYNIYEAQVEVDFRKCLPKLLYNNNTSPIMEIGDKVGRDGVIFAYARVNSDNGYFKSKRVLSSVTPSDKVFYLPEDSELIDISIYTSKLDNIKNDIIYNMAIDMSNFNKNIIDGLMDAIMTYPSYTKSYNYQVEFDKAKAVVYNQDGVMSASGFRRAKHVLPDSAVLVTFQFMKKSRLKPGSKISGRHGNKGVDNKSKIKHLFGESKLYDDLGREIECIQNALSIINRSNLAQIYESDLTNTLYTLAYNVRDRVNKGECTYTDLYHPLINVVLSNTAPEHTVRQLYLIDKYKKQGVPLEFIMSDICERILNFRYTVYINPTPEFLEGDMIDGYVYDYDKLGFIYKNETEPYKNNIFKIFCTVHDTLAELGYPLTKRKLFIKNDKGEMVDTGVEAEVSPLYFYLLEQAPEKKLVVRAQGAYDVKGAAAKTMAKKERTARYTDTPVRMGERDLLTVASINEEEAVLTVLRQSDSENVKSLYALFKALGVKLMVSYNEKQKENVEDVYMEE